MVVELHQGGFATNGDTPSSNRPSLLGYIPKIGFKKTCKLLLGGGERKPQFLSGGSLINLTGGGGGR